MIMSKFLKTAALSIGLVTGVAFAAHAQSVSSLPPSGGAPQSATPPAATQAMVPTPGGSVNWKEPTTQPPQDATASFNDHPYSATMDHSGSGPKPN
jgi:hypothetical protein